MIIDNLNKLKTDGIYKVLVNSGVIPIKVNYYMDLYNDYNVRLIVNEKRSDTIMQSITDVSQKFGCSELTVRNAIKMMKSY